jgi:hypothetical protein
MKPYTRTQYALRLPDGRLLLDHSLIHPQLWDSRKEAERAKGKGMKVVKVLTICSDVRILKQLKRIVKGAL